MFRTIGSRILLVHIGYFLLFLGLVAATAFQLERQKTDGLVVNLAGRQRMLTQRMTHQLMAFARGADQNRDVEALRARVLSSMQVFETTLSALTQGGKAPLDLESVNMRQVPAPSQEVQQQLLRVAGIYKQYRVEARAILEGDILLRETGISYVIEHNTELLSEMNAAVNLMQNEAEHRVSELYAVLAIALGAAILLSRLLSALTRRMIVEPLAQLNLASDAMSRGDVVHPIEVRGPQEIRDLGSSFERLRVSMRSLLGDPRQSGAL